MAAFPLRSTDDSKKQILTGQILYVRNIRNQSRRLAEDGLDGVEMKHVAFPFLPGSLCLVEMCILCILLQD